VNLKKGDRLVVVVGQKGWDNPSNSDWGGAGGGGTFVALVGEKGDRIPSLKLNVDLLVAAGGGSGMNDRRNSGQAKGGKTGKPFRSDTLAHEKMHMVYIAWLRGSDYLQIPKLARSHPRCVVASCNRLGHSNLQLTPYLRLSICPCIDAPWEHHS